MKNILIGACLITGLLMAPVFASSDRPDLYKSRDVSAAKEYLSSFIEDLVDSEDLTGLSIAIVDGDRIVWEKGFGLANDDEDIAASEHTVFRVGGISTILTAIAVVQLAEKNLINLDAPVSQYLPEFKVRYVGDPGSAITVRNLLTHHAGLPYAVIRGMWSNKPVSLSDHLKQLSEEYAPYPPNLIHAYSNAGYSVLGAMVERVTRRRFDEYLRTEVLASLNMFSSDFALTEALRKRLSVGYKDGDPKVQLPVRDVPSLGLYSTAHDLAQLLRLYLNPAGKKVLSVGAIAKMLSVQNSKVALDVGQQVGIGWSIRPEMFRDSGSVVERSGATLLFRSRITMLPVHQLGVVVMANSSNAYRVLEKINEEVLSVMYEVKTGKKAEEQSNVVTTNGAVANPSFRPGYATNIGFIAVSKNSDEYVADVMGWDVKLRPRVDNWFNLEYSLFGFIPIKLDWVTETKVSAALLGGRQVLLANVKGRDHLFGVETMSAPTIPAAWAKLVGEYKIVNPDELIAHYEVKTGQLQLYNGRLVFTYALPWVITLQARLPLSPVNDQLAVIEGLGAGLNEVVQVLNRNGTTVLRYSGYELEKIN